MAHIISAFIAYLGYRVTGYDFFVLLTLTTLSTDIYKALTKYFKILKRYLIYAKDKTARRQIFTSDNTRIHTIPDKITNEPQHEAVINQSPSFYFILIPCPSTRKSFRHFQQFFGIFFYLPNHQYSVINVRPLTPDLVLKQLHILHGQAQQPPLPV